MTSKRPQRVNDRWLERNRDSALPNKIDVSEASQRTNGRTGREGS